MSETFESIKKGLNEAFAHATGKSVGAVVHQRKTIDVRAIRDQIGMSESELATSMGVKPSTIRDWERGVRTPRGPARALLDILAKYPEVVLGAQAARG